MHVSVRLRTSDILTRGSISVVTRVRETVLDSVSVSSRGWDVDTCEGRHGDLEETAFQQKEMPAKCASVRAVGHTKWVLDIFRLNTPRQWSTVRAPFNARQSFSTAAGMSFLSWLTQCTKVRAVSVSSIEANTP